MVLDEHRHLDEKKSSKLMEKCWEAIFAKSQILRGTVMKKIKTNNFFVFSDFDGWLLRGHRSFFIKQSR